MISEERSNQASKQPLNFPISLLVRSPKNRTGKLGRNPSNGSAESNITNSTTRSEESVGVRQPAKNKLRRYNYGLPTVFNRTPPSRDSGQGDAPVVCRVPAQEQESCQESTPEILKIYGNDICKGANYKSVLATRCSSAKELIREALERYSLDKEQADAYVLCDVIGLLGEDHLWRTECARVVGENERPLLLQALWTPKKGFSRRFEIQKRADVREKSAKEEMTVTRGINAQAPKPSKNRWRVTSLFIEDGAADGGWEMWKSLSEMDLCGRGADGGRETPSHEDPEAEALRGWAEQEETESSADYATQYSIHPPVEFPYFLLLQGYSHRQDFVIYLMSGTSAVFGHCSELSTGQSGEALQIDVPLFSPDVLPQHCRAHRRQAQGRAEPREWFTVLGPLGDASVVHNGVSLKGEAELSPGDLIGLGQHYLFMYKDPTSASASQMPPWLAWSSSLRAAPPCQTCCSPQGLAYRGSALSLMDSEGRELSLAYEPEQEGLILRKIVTMADSLSEKPKLTPAFLLCLCIQHTARAFGAPHLHRLLLKIASQIQVTTLEKTEELAAVQPEMKHDSGLEDTGPEETQALSIAELFPSIEPLVLWMANAIELLHFIQQEVPRLLPQSGEVVEENTGVNTGLLNTQVGTTQSASQEAVTVLEEVIMFTFQQSVYYLTKTLYSALPSLFDSNPFSESGQLQVPKAVRCVLDVLKETLRLLTSSQVHSEMTSQIFAYLFFFTNTSLFNALMERGTGGGFYQWSRGVQIRANLDLVLDWIQGVGLGDLAADFFQKLSSAVNLLATPKENLMQASWCSLRTEFEQLNPAQLHHVLQEYHSGRAHPAAWSPTPGEAESARRTADVLESFDNHPPLILPGNSFHLGLGKPIKDAGLCAQLSQLQDFLLSLRVSGSPVAPGQPWQTNHNEEAENEQPGPSSPTVALQDSVPPEVKVADTATSPEPCPEEQPEAGGTTSGQGSDSSGINDLSSCRDVLTQKLKSLEFQSNLPRQTALSCHKGLALDPSCLLTPPNTPQGLELAEQEAGMQGGGLLPPAAHLQRKGEGWSPGGIDLRNREEKVEREEVFTVELKRGPDGLGLALVDGMKTQLKVSGIFIKSMAPDSPAALCQKLSLGDRILAVNGSSLVGTDFQTGRELIQTSGETLRFLVAKSEWKSTCLFTKC